MTTVALNAYSKAYPLITNGIRASVYLQSSPQALVASIIDTTTGHPARTWSFPGLPRANYGFSLDEIDDSGNVLANLALFDVTPGEVDGLLTREDEQIKVDTTTGFVSGTAEFIFDGTLVSGVQKPNYVGWDIVPSELNGRGILVRGLDYNWFPETGTFVLLQPGDLFTTNTYYNIHFEPIQNPVGNSYPTVTDFTIRLMTSGGNASVTDFGNKLIIEPVVPYCEIALPSIITVPEGRIMTVEVGGTGFNCVKFPANGSDVINFANGDIYAYCGETFSVYRFNHPTRGNEWRVCDAEGNFKTVGRIVTEDKYYSDVLNSIPLDGNPISVSTYARLYNDFVLQLPLAQTCNFDDWSTGNNMYLYSLANSSNPIYANQFRTPDRRGLFEKNNSTGKAGDYNTDSVNNSKVIFRGTKVKLATDPYDANGVIVLAPATGSAISPTPTQDITNTYPESGTYNQPRNYVINKYVLI